ncbi:MAG: hypothetical protein HUJ68_13280 [Clostridia bacterium]|nr:hypothetical protein [Clostridia bacterium]
MEIKGAGTAFIQNCSKKWTLISNVLQAWNANDSKIFCEFAGGINGDKIIAEMNKKLSNMKFSFFLSLFDFDGFGVKKLELLEDLPEFEAAYNGDFAKLFEKPITAKVKGLSQESLNDLYEQLLEKKDDILNSFAILNSKNIIKKPTSSGGKFSGMNFCFTGKCECGWKRSECEAKVVELGGKVTAVNKDLTYLVTDDADSGSAKAKKAKELGSKVITSFEFKEMCD